MSKANTADPDRNKTVEDIKAEEAAALDALQKIRQRRAKKERERALAEVPSEIAELVGKTVQIGPEIYLRLGELVVDQNGNIQIAYMQIERVVREPFSHDPYYIIRQDRMQIAQAQVWTEYVDAALFDDLFRSVVAGFRRDFKVSVDAK